ncbi:MAG TPA: VCBS repeat-containing protein, partial [Anaerolineales bacterium]
MGTPKASGAKSWPTRLLFGLLWILGSAALCGGIVYAGLAVTDQLGEYSGSSVVVDLDSDGDLDVVTVNIRRESELTSFAGATLWFNQGGKKFTPVNPELGGIAAAAGDVDRDGDADLFVLPTFEMVLVLNQGGAQGGRTGTFKVNNPIYPAGLSATYGSIVLGDLNGDGQVDGFVAGCCGMSYPGPSGQTTYTPPVSFVWINDWDPRGWLVRHAAVVPELENLPVPAAALGDLNGDGSLDVYAAVQPPKTGGVSASGEWVLFNDGRGSFRDSGQRLGAGNSSSVALGDLDG